MNKKQVIRNTLIFTKQKMGVNGNGHDWRHAYRVWKLSLEIAKQEKKSDLFVVQLAALLHDISDWKFSNGDESLGQKVASNFLKKQNVDEETISNICDIINNISFKGAEVQSKMSTLEGMIVQDADRLDAIGAIGIARAFMYAGNKNRELYDPKRKPEDHRTFKQYKESNSTAVNHFYEKLLLLKDLMNTKTGKSIASKRHMFMKLYLNQFFSEWNGTT